METPSAAGYSQPAEWSPHEAVWLAWPSHADLWGEALEPVRRAFVEMVRAILDADRETLEPRGERVEILVPDEAAERTARAQLGVGDARASALRGVRFHAIPFGDIWLRDTAPVFVRRAGDGQSADSVAAVRFGFNGWGGKYVLPHDAEVSARVAAAATTGSAKGSGLRAFSFPWVLEGGSVEADGEGTLLTTRQCLLHPNRNPGWTASALEEGLGEALGARRVLWLGDGLLNDHTDGHVDTIARFVAPGRVVCMSPSGGNDPNADALLAIERDLASFRDAQGRALEVVTVPSPGLVPDEDGEPMPASYVNFYIGNRAVVVPVYGVPGDARAVETIASLFPGRTTRAVPARELLEGGGAFHCISQQQPGRP